MGKPTTENSKKAAGNAKKAAVKAEKEAAEASKVAAVEDKEWKKGAKSTAKKEADADKKAEAARKKAERDAQLAEEEANAPSKPKGTNNPKAGGASKKNTTSAAGKPASTPARGLDLGALDDEGPPSRTAAAALNASGIDNALDALALTSGGGGGGGGGDKVERHPERRFKAAYAAYEARRMPQVEQESPGLRRQQRVDLIRKEFEKSEENPFNQTTVRYDASRSEIQEVRKQERDKTEKRLGEKT